MDTYQPTRVTKLSFLWKAALHPPPRTVTGRIVYGCVPLAVPMPLYFFAAMDYMSILFYGLFLRSQNIQLLEQKNYLKLTFFINDVYLQFLWS